MQLNGKILSFEADMRRLGLVYPGEVLGEEKIERGGLTIKSIWDNGGKTVDRYTIVFTEKADSPSLRGQKGFMALGVDGNGGRDFSQFGDAVEGKHLGKKLDFKSLPDEVQKHILSRMDEELSESENQRGKRDGSGPYKDSLQRKAAGKGKRQMAGEKCPFSEDMKVQGEDEEDDMINPARPWGESDVNEIKTILQRVCPKTEVWLEDSDTIHVRMTPRFFKFGTWEISRTNHKSKNISIKYIDGPLEKAVTLKGYTDERAHSIREAARILEAFAKFNAEKIGGVKESLGEEDNDEETDEEFAHRTEQEEAEGEGEPKKIAKIRQIVKDSQRGKVDGKMIDATTASAIIRVYEAIKDAEMKKRFGNLPIMKMINVTWQMMK